jgi:hypothetical protein
MPQLAKKKSTASTVCVLKSAQTVLTVFFCELLILAISLIIIINFVEFS